MRAALRGVQAISVAGLDVSMRSTGAAVVQVVLGGSGAARTEGLRWKVPELGTVPAKPGASILETGAAIAKRAEHLGGVSRGPELRMPLHGCAIEGFMQSFVAGRFRTQSLFLLAQLNGLAANALWDVGGAPPLVLMPNAVRALLLVPTLSECEKEEEALYRALGREPPPPPDPGAASAALKRAVLRRIAMMDQDAAWPVRGPSAASASVTDLVRRHSPPGAEATQRRRLEALLLLTESVSDEAFDMADAAGVATAAALNAIGVLTATSSPSLKLALARHRQARSASAEDEQALLDVEPDARALGSPCCRQEGLDGPPCAGRRAAEIGALIARHGTKASVAALGAADAETRVRLCAALGAAWLKALAQAGDTARAGHGKLPTGWKPGAGTEPDAGSEAECPRCKHVGMSLGALGAWPWGGVSPALAKATIDNLSAAVAKAANAKTRQSSRLGLKQPDVELLGPIVAGLRLGATAAASAALAAPFLRPWARFHGDGGGFLAFTQDDGVVPKEARKVILWGAAVNVALGALKVGVGSAAGSSALVADGVHSVSDIVSDVVTLAAMRVARLPPDENHLFGHGRVEAIGTLGVSGLLLMASGGIAVHAYSAAQALLPGLRGEGAALAAPDSSAGAALAEVAAAAADGSASLDPALSAAFVAAVVGIAAKEWLFRWTAAVAERVSSSTLLANAWHHRSDAFSSVVAAAGVGGALAGLPLVDPVGGLVVAAMIAKQGVDMGVGALRELSDEAADPSTTAAVQQALLDAAPGEILSVRRLRTRVLGHYVAAEAEIGVNPATTLTSANALARVAEAHVRRQCPRVADLSVAVGPHICDGAAGTAARGSGADGTAGDPSGGAVARQQHASPSQVPRRLPGKVEDDIVSHVIRAVPAVRRVTHLRLHFLPGGRRCTAEMEIELRDFSQTLHDACMVAASARRAAELVHEVVRADVHIEVRDDGKRQR
ncbi:hypothetical protein FNF31_06967 [Cafeteria roenbergensis]|uniref:Uncharacterized protein n=1 Tax=Cafeteria roenbergensis TaxID=33653 RepID=A0A5A8CCM4_CAFRO|nr:hypothetical protein FNF31_06967 [Cafeteria roenbergensis]